MKEELFDIEAKVGTEDLAEWQKEKVKPFQQRVMLHAMLRAVLADRCKLVLHTATTEVPGYALVVSKHGPKLTEATPDETFPSGMSPNNDGGGSILSRRGQAQQATFYGTSMASLAIYLTGATRPWGPIQDKTGLTSRYDFVLHPRDMSSPSASQDGVSAADPGGSICYWELDSLGLELKPSKGTIEELVIDHIERPSPN